PRHRPHWVKRVERIPMTDGFRPDKSALESAAFGEGAELFAYDERAQRYGAAPRDGAEIGA
ncbi:MAG: hypothetical protein WBN30_11775, partial [Polyangiales bacterium]